MILNVKTAPVKTPITAIEAKSHARITVTTEQEDADILAYIKAATLHAEAYMNRALITQTLVYKRDQFPCERRGEIAMPRPPLQSVTSFKYYDSQGVQQTVTAYQLDKSSEPARISPNAADSWGTVDTERLGNIEIEYKAGYGDNETDIDEQIRQAIRLIFGEFYNNRELSVIGVSVSPVIKTAEMLLDPYRIFFEESR